jgi:hypothetical protein
LQVRHARLFDQGIASLGIQELGVSNISPIEIVEQILAYDVSTIPTRNGQVVEISPSKHREVVCANPSSVVVCSHEVYRSARSRVLLAPHLWPSIVSVSSHVYDSDSLER